MEISSILDSSIDTTSVSQKENKTASSFDGYFLDASASSTSGSVSGDPSGDDAVEEFMHYAKETPAERMFDNWLHSQNITEQQYDAMTPAEKQKLVDQFETQMKQKLGAEVTGLSGASVAS